jgi:hypothetical protein
MLFGLDFSVQTPFPFPVSKLKTPFEKSEIFVFISFIHLFRDSYHHDTEA